MEIIKSNKGKDKLMYEGYAYHLHKELTKTTRWRCHRHNVFKVSENNS